MLEIAILVFLTRRNILEAKTRGHSGALFGVLTVLLWVILEIIGAVVGVVAFELEMLGAGLVGILFGAMGGLISYLIVQSLPKRTVTPPPRPLNIPTDLNEPQWYQTQNPDSTQKKPYEPPYPSSKG